VKSAAGPTGGPGPSGDRNNKRPPRPNRDAGAPAAGNANNVKRKNSKPQPTSAFAEELAKAL
jgi:hypothetical protein